MADELTDAEAAVLRVVNLDYSQRREAESRIVIRGWDSENADAGRAALAAYDAQKECKILDIVFDGPPGPKSGRFVETEDEHGHGVNCGDWIDRGNGLWALRIQARFPPCFPTTKETTHAAYDAQKRREILRPALELLETIEAAVDRHTTSGGTAQSRPVIVAQATIDAIRDLLAKEAP